MITITGNNFGASQFDLKDYQSEKIVVLNGCFTFNNKSESFKAASVLEIYVPELSIPKSGMSSAYLMFESEGKFYGTTVKTWLKNQTTICIEKLDYWSDQTDEYTIYLVSLYAPKGQRGVFELGTKTRLTLNNTTSTNNYAYNQACYVSDDWCMVTLATSRFDTQSKAYDEIVELGGFPVDVDAELPFVGDNINSIQNYGTDMLKASINNGVLTIHSLPFGWGGMPKEHFLYGVFVRDKSLNPIVD